MGEAFQEIFPWCMAMENIRCDVDENLWPDQQEQQDVHQESFLYTVGTESIQTPLNFSLFVILQPFAKII